MGDLVIRPATAGDDGEVRRVVSAAFTDHGDEVADLVEALRASRHTRGELVAVEDDAVVGHVQVNHSWLDARERLVDVLVLSPLSVHPSRQRRGTGTALVAAVLRVAEELGSPLVYLEGSPDYYGARGFVRSREVGVERPSERIPEAASQVHLLAAHEGWMRGRLVYCDPFWTHDCVGLRDPRLGEVERGSA